MLDEIINWFTTKTMRHLERRISKLTRKLDKQESRTIRRIHRLKREMKHYKREIFALKYRMKTPHVKVREPIHVTAVYDTTA